MKNSVKIKESELHGLVSESIKKVLSEISTDTLGSARDKAYQKWRESAKDQEATVAEREHAKNRVSTFGDEYRKRRNWNNDGTETNDAHKARFDKRERDRMKGKRTYGNHCGDGRKMWRTVDEAINESIKDLLGKK